MVGAAGFEPATSWSQTKCSSQAELRSDLLNYKIYLLYFAIKNESQFDFNSQTAQQNNPI